MNISQMDSSTVIALSTAAKSSPATATPSTAANSSPTPTLALSAKVVKPIAHIPIVVNDVVSPSPTTLGGASHTHFFFITQLLSWMLKM
jgi:hypothetical protein